jgi:hypothetical protein
MNERIKYDIQRLNKYCEENHVTLLDNYDDKPLTKNYMIKGNCIYTDCKNVFEKKFINLLMNGAYCDVCKKIVAIERMKKSFLQNYGSENILQLDFIKHKTNINKFNNDKLVLYCNERNIKLADDYTNSYLTKKSVIKTECQTLNCHGIVEKVFREIEKRGAYCKSCTQQIKTKKIKEACLEKYGAECPLSSEVIQNKMKQTNLHKYGVEYTFQNEDIKNKIKKVCIEKYGVENPNQNANIMDKCLKSSYLRKIYIFPSGTIENIQGYEHFALDELIINENIDESDIIIGAKNVPEIWYFDDGKKHRHYVDIYIPKQNRCIEVKSTYTYTKHKRKNLLKEEAAKKLGFNYEFWIYNNKGEKIPPLML